MRRLLAVIFTLAGFLIPGLAFAIGDSSSILSGHDIFTPPMTDKSMVYLGQVFGTVGGVIHGTSGQILGQIFYVFNYAMVIIVSLMMVYIIIKTILDTAQDGEFMGKKTNSAWLIFRAVTSIGILVPKYTGYSLVQVFIMWAVVQGIGLADKTWSHALDYVSEEGGIIYSSPMKGDDFTNSLSTAQKIFTSEVCMYRMEDVAKSEQDQAKASLKDNPLNSALAAKAGQRLPMYRPYMDVDGKSVLLGYSDRSQIANGKGIPPTQSLCGSYSWKQDGASAKFEQYKRAGLEQMVMDLSPAAKSMAESVDQTLTEQQKTHLKQKIVSGLVGAAADYENIMLPATRSAKADAGQEWKKTIESAKEKGWIVAGSYYWDLASVQEKFSKTINEYQPSGSGISANLKDYGINEVEIRKATDGINSYVDMANLLKMAQYLQDNDTSREMPAEFKAQWMEKLALTSSQAGINAISQAAYKYDSEKTPVFKVEDIAKTAGWMAGGLVGMTAASAGAPLLPIGMGIFSGGLVSLVGVWFGAMNAPGDPLAMVQMLGRGMVGIAVGIWLSITIVLGGLSTILSIGDSVTGLAYGIQNTLRFFTPVVLAFVLVLFTNGMVLSVYVPLIPFLIFTFAAIGWLISVLEGIVAAPLVAAALTHPEGHDLLGKTEQTIILLMGVFLRPVVMIIGFIAAIVLARVGLRIINAGFSHAVEAANITLSGVNIFGIIGIMIVYTMIVISLVNMVFTAGVVKLWETIWMWIGYHQPSGAVEQAMHEIQGGLRTAAQAGGDAIGGLVRGGSDLRSDQLHRGEEGKVGGLARSDNGKWSITKSTKGAGLKQTQKTQAAPDSTGTSQH